MTIRVQNHTLPYCVQFKYNENGCAINSNFISINLYIKPLGVFCGNPFGC